MILSVPHTLAHHMITYFGSATAHAWFGTVQACLRFAHAIGHGVCIIR